MAAAGVPVTGTVGCSQDGYTENTMIETLSIALVKLSDAQKLNVV